MRSFVEEKRVFALLPAVFALGWVLHQQVFGVQIQQLSITEVASKREKTLQRSPASVADESESILLFDCSQPNIMQKEAGFHLLRIIGKNCKPDTQIQVRHIDKNLTADLFWLKKEQFSTDLIRLQNGINTIEVTYIRGSKKESHNLKIHNSPSKSKKAL